MTTNTTDKKTDALRKAKELHAFVVAENPASYSARIAGELVSYIEALAATAQPEQPVGVVSLQLSMDNHNKEAPATEQAPELPPPDTATDLHKDGMGEGAYTAEAMRERDAMWMAKIAALRSEQAPAGEAPPDLRMLGYELEGVIIDVEQGHGFDDVCLGTIKRVRAALSTPPAVPPAKDLSATKEWSAELQARLIEMADEAEEAERSIMGEAACLLKHLTILLSAAPAAPQGEQPA